MGIRSNNFNIEHSVDKKNGRERCLGSCAGLILVWHKSFSDVVDQTKVGWNAVWGRVLVSLCGWI